MAKPKSVFIDYEHIVDDTQAEPVGSVDSAESFAAAAERYVPAMARLAARLVAAADRDDLVQDALILAWRRRATFDPTRSNVGTWLLLLVVDRARKSSRRRSHPTVAATRPDAHTDTQPDVDLDRAIAGLPRRQRLAITLHYFCDLPVNDTAVVMGCAEGTVKATLHHARQALATALGDSDR